MSIEIKALTLGIAATNCYIVGDTQIQQAVVIDPVDNAQLLYETAQAEGWKIALILATHGHYDHVLASEELAQLTGAPFYIHHATPQANLKGDEPPFIHQLFPPIVKPARLLGDDLETITVGSIRLETLFTPGHAPDHVSYYLPDYRVLFGGDCLFAGSIGRTDLPYADHQTLMNSIFDRILPLGDEIQILPGHMSPTTIGKERQNNPFLLNSTGN